jgi:hypothetical protein
MPKIAYLLSAVLLLGFVAVQPVQARDNHGNYNNGKQGSWKSGKSDNNWKSRSNTHRQQKATNSHSKNQKNDRFKSAGSHKKDGKKSAHGKYKGKSQQDSKYSWNAKRSNTAKHSARPKVKGNTHYRAKPPVKYTNHKKSYYNHRKPHNAYKHKNYYRPKYVYVKPYPKARYHGYYPYRGFYWPFVSVNFVVNLSNRQIERHHQAVYTALDAPVGEVVTWFDNGRHGTIVIVREGMDSNGNICKEYRQTISYYGQVNTQTVVSCLSPDGYWVTP